MSRVQVLLVFMTGGSAVLYFAAFRSRLWDRLLVLLLAVAGTYLILDPDQSTLIAHKLGVGRGADLVFYIAIVGMGFVELLLFSQVRQLEDRLTRLTRATATIQTPSPHSGDPASETT